MGVPCGLNGGWRSFQCAWLGIQGLGALFHCGMWNLAIQRGGRATMRDVGKFWTHQNVGNSKQKTVRFSMSSIQFGMMYFRCAAHRHARNLAGIVRFIGFTGNLDFISPGGRLSLTWRSCLQRPFLASRGFGQFKEGNCLRWLWGLPGHCACMCMSRSHKLCPSDV